MSSRRSSSATARDAIRRRGAQATARSTASTSCGRAGSSRWLRKDRARVSEALHVELERVELAGEAEVAGIQPVVLDRGADPPSAAARIDGIQHAAVALHELLDAPARRLQALANRRRRDLTDGCGLLAAQFEHAPST
jgi:hypothetical protein